MSFSKQTVRDIAAQIKGQTVLVRADYNVSLKNGQVMDDLRIRANLPTLEFLRQAGAAKIVVISHLGRPKGQRQAELSLAPVAEELRKLLPATYTVHFVDEVYGEKVSAAVRDLPEGGILLLENLRFWPEEEQNDLEFARKIVGATGAKWFVQDGFAVIHRAHASTSAITELLPAVAGLLVEQEVGTLEKVLDDPERPLAVVIGGAKVEDKQPLIDKFADLADAVVVGGKISADGYQSDNPKVKVADEDFDEDTAEDTDVKSESELDQYDSYWSIEKKTINGKTTYGATVKTNEGIVNKTDLTEDQYRNLIKSLHDVNASDALKSMLPSNDDKKKAIEQTDKKAKDIANTATDAYDEFLKKLGVSESGSFWSDFDKIVDSVFGNKTDDFKDKSRNYWRY